ncbi:MAG TPA: FKBP-type peptidyl-prolyl cis-trans isomerase [Terracidiphilus sp.]|nr:FKBP-type peptidyl-prolyl cis-trans isomerase [Terracidiphilus sp.]
MNRFFLLLSLAAFSLASGAQTPAPKPATPKSASTAGTKPASSAAATKPMATAATPQLTPWIRLPKGVPVVAHGPVKMPFALRYEDIVVGKGAVGESGKVWHIKYTGWRAADGAKFDSWEDHKQPEFGPDGKPKMGPDGKPVMGEPKPIEIPIGVGRVIPGFDYGVDGMRIGGKRRIFIPWQMAYGTHAIPDRPERPGSPASPGIPAKSDLIFDVELVDVTEASAPHPPMMPPAGRPMPMPPHPGTGAPPNATPPPGASTPKPATPEEHGAPAGSAPGSAPSTQPSTPPPSTTPSTTPAPSTPPPTGSQAPPSSQH